MQISIMLHKAGSKLIKDNNINSDTFNLKEQKVVNSLEPIVTGDSFLKRIPMAQALRSKIDKWDLKKLKSFSMAKDTIIQTNSRLQNGKDFYQLHI